MDYSVLADYYEKLESVSSKLKKRDILAELFRITPTEELPKVVLLVQGIVFPRFADHELGVAVQMMIKAISKSSGVSMRDVENKFKETGDLGSTAEYCIKSRKQSTLLRKKLTVDNVFSILQSLAFVVGQGSQGKKLSLISKLLVSGSPKEVRYIARTILEDLRVGVAEGIIRDAIVEAFLAEENVSKEEKQKISDLVEYSFNIVSDFGEVAKIAKEGGVEALKKVKVQIGKPIQGMLGLAAESIEEVVKEFGKISAQYKYDGSRVQIHRSGEKIWVYTRRLEDITKQFPDIVEFCKKGLKSSECIVEGEALGIDRKTGFPVPFQILSQRIHRKYDIKKMVREIPVMVHLFDVLHENGKMLFDKPLKERWRILEEIVARILGKFQLAKQIVRDDLKELEKFYEESLKAGQEGLMLKVLESPYIFGRHVGTMYKIKPLMESLDLIIVGATWGEGARTNWLTSYILACVDPDTGKLLEVGMMSTGLNEAQYSEMTEKLKPLITSEKGRTVYVKPKIIVEVGYQEIQKSPHSTSGFSLRFPRFIRERTEKSEPDTLERIESLFKSQGKVG